MIHIVIKVIFEEQRPRREIKSGTDQHPSCFSKVKSHEVAGNI